MCFLYHNPKCSKSREALKLLQSYDINVKVVLYLKKPPNFEDLSNILLKLNKNPSDIIRKTELTYKENINTIMNMSDIELTKFMCKHPILIERPIFVKGSKAIIARPPSNLLEFINAK